MNFHYLDQLTMTRKICDLKRTFEFSFEVSKQFPIYTRIHFVPFTLSSREGKLEIRKNVSGRSDAEDHLSPSVSLRQRCAGGVGGRPAAENRVQRWKKRRSSLEGVHHDTPRLLEPRNDGETGLRRIQRSARRGRRKVGGNRPRTSFSFDTGRSVEQFVIERFEPPFSSRVPRSSSTIFVWEFYLFPRIPRSSP